MLGNVNEWVWDWYSAYPMSEHASAGPFRGDKRAIRGGSFNDEARWGRAAYRARRPPGNSDFDLGFHPVRSARTR